MSNNLLISELIKEKKYTYKLREYITLMNYNYLNIKYFLVK